MEFEELLTDEAAKNIQRILDHPIEIDEDYADLASLVEDESLTPNSQFA